jgi:hypothetical protein
MEVKAVYVKDSKRYHRYEIEGTDITGSIYITKNKDVPKTITVTLAVKDAASKEE